MVLHNWLHESARYFVRNITESKEQSQNQQKVSGGSRVPSAIQTETLPKSSLAGIESKGKWKKISHLSWLGLEIVVVSSRITSARRRETLQKIIRMDGMSKSRGEIVLFADDSQIVNLWLKRCRPNPYQPNIYCSVNLRRMPLILLPTTSLRLNYLPLLSDYFVFSEHP